MEIYLPVIDFNINFFTIIFLSLLVGFFSGLFGIGGGFFLTPLLIFLGIPANYAVPNVANSILGISVSGAFTHWYKKTLDYKMGLYIMLGGFFGTILGLYFFQLIKKIGNINEVIALIYMYLLTILGTLILVQGIKEISYLKKKIVKPKKLHNHNWIHGLPLRTRFIKSKLYVSSLAPVVLGFFVGLFASMLGVGGAFIMVPALIYIIAMPTSLVPGTSLFVTVFITIFVVAGHALQFGSLDIILVSLLVFSSLFGLHIGIKISEKLNGSEYKTLLAILLIAVGVLIGIETFVLDIFNQSITQFTEKNNYAPSSSDLNNFIKVMSSDSPLIYSLACILFVSFIGYSFSATRQLAHNYIENRKVNKDQ